MAVPLSISLDEILFQLALTGPQGELTAPMKALFWGEGAGGISSFVAGWVAGRGIGVIVLDGANRFDPYRVTSFARSAFIPPERLLKNIRIARAFTCYQMATLIGEKLPLLLEQEGAIQPESFPFPFRRSSRKPWVILLGPVTPFLDEDVPDKEIGPLFERALKKVEGMASKGVSFLLFQPSIPSNSKRGYLAKRLFQFSDLIWRIQLEDQGLNIVPLKELNYRDIPGGRLYGSLVTAKEGTKSQVPIVKQMAKTPMTDIPGTK